MKRSNLSLVLSLLVVFASGAVVGALGHRYYSLNTVAAKGVPKSPEEYRKQYMTEMQSRLKLDSAQEQKLAQILDETREKFRQFREKTRPETKAIQEEQIARINEMLTPAQVAEYAKMRKEREEKRKAEDTSRK
jgi:hypothetical protein